MWDSLKFGARALSLKAAMQRPQAATARMQRRRLARLLQHVQQHSPHFQDKLAGIDPAGAALSELPTSNKAEIMENFDRVLTVRDVTRAEIEDFVSDDNNLGKYFRGKYVLSHTSGSQGQPLLIVQTKSDLELLFAMQAARGNRQDLGVWQVLKRYSSPARLATVTLQRGFYPSGAAFEYMPAGARRFIRTLRLSLGDDDMAKRLAEFRPTHLTAYASVLHELARLSEQGSLSLRPELEQIVNISERLMPKARRRYEEVFGAPVLDAYAMGECLFLSSGCLSEPGMHVNADWAILEVVDDKYQPVPPGEKGAKVLLTNLSNRVQPFIRYEIGDIVTWAKSPCDCGNNLPLIAKVEGRDSDMFWVETSQGRRPMQPAIFDLAFANISHAREYQVIHEENGRVRIRVEPLPGEPLEPRQAQQAVEEQLREVGLERDVRVEVEVVDRLSPQNGRKFKRYISDVRNARAAAHSA